MDKPNLKTTAKECRTAIDKDTAAIEASVGMDIPSLIVNAMDELYTLNRGAEKPLVNISDKHSFVLALKTMNETRKLIDILVSSSAADGNEAAVELFNPHSRLTEMMDNTALIANMRSVFGFRDEDDVIAGLLGYLGYFGLLFQTYYAALAGLRSETIRVTILEGLEMGELDLAWKTSGF